MNMNCPLCGKRISEWNMSAGKTMDVNGRTVHKSCLMDYQRETGKEYADDSTRSAS